MKKLFVHHPLFRLLSPLFSGVVIYLLILLINNNVGQLKEQFLSEELYVCIALSYLIQEGARALLVLFDRIAWPLWLQIFANIFLSILLVSTAIVLYYKHFVGFMPDSRELSIFNTIFLGVSLLYILLYLSHQFLYARNTKKLREEEYLREQVKENFEQFKSGLRPELLFESLETLLSLMPYDREQADELLNQLSQVYRYLLSGRKQELVPFEEEWRIVQDLVCLFDHLPHRRIQLDSKQGLSGWLVPGALLMVVENIIRRTIASPYSSLSLYFSETGQVFFIEYEHFEKLEVDASWAALEVLQKRYAIYTDAPIRSRVDGKRKRIEIPKLTLK